MATIQGVNHGKTIELEEDCGLPEGQRVAVDVRPLEQPPAWLDRFVVSPEVVPGKLVIIKEVNVLPVDEAVARKFGEARAWQLDHGLYSPELDLLNGAVALAHGLTMVTHNTSDYAGIPGLTVDDWLA